MTENIESGAPTRRDPRPFDGTELLIPFGGIAFATYYLSTIWSLPWEAKMSGMFLGIAVLALCAVFFLRALTALMASRMSLSIEEVFGTGSLFVRRLGIVVLAVLYMVILEPLGFTLATFLFLLTGMALLGVRSPKLLLGVPFALAAAGYLLFIVALSSDLPEGIVARLVDSLVGNGG